MLEPGDKTQKTRSRANLRTVAAQIVDAVVYDGRSLDAAIGKYERRVAVNDRALLRKLCYGTLRDHWRLRGWIDTLISKRLKKRDRIINSLLAVGLYQIAETRIPDHAVVSETVDAVHELRRPKLAGLVNACLRRFVREDLGANDEMPDTARWNHPQWMIDTVQRDWPNDWQAILGANNNRAPMWLRVNSSQSSTDGYARRLADLGIDAESVPGVPGALRLLRPMAVDELPGFANGDVSVQDAAAQLAAPWLLQGRGGRLLDACAAPGGKSGHLLELGGDDVDLVALDNDPSRTVRITENLARIGRTATIIVADASNPEDWWNGEPFDCVLLDAPCSASGVVRRHPDIKLLRRGSDIERLSVLQGTLLNALWPLVARGGRLLYVTCSIFAAENDAVVGQFLKEHSDALENDVLPNNNVHDLMRRRGFGYQILPGTAGLDGFYYACLEKRHGPCSRGPAKVS